MHSLDHPDEFTFVRDGQVQLTGPEKLVAWDRVLTGMARERVMPKLPLDAIRKADTQLNQALGILRNAANK